MIAPEHVWDDAVEEALDPTNYVALPRVILTQPVADFVVGLATLAERTGRARSVLYALQDGRSYKIIVEELRER